MLLEVKVSRSDFFSDAKKVCRQEGKGIGDKRAYLTPKGLLKPEEVPYGWQLWEVHGKTRPFMKVIKGHKSCKEINPHFGGKTIVWYYEHCTRTEVEHFCKPYGEKSFRAELSWLLKIFGRAYEDGVDLSIYANNYQRKD